MTLLRAGIEELKEQLEANENKLLQKDAELSTVQVQLGDCKRSSQTFQVRLSSLQRVLATAQIAILNFLLQDQLGIPLRLSWKQCSDVPFLMHSSTNPVTLNEKVYMVGGGVSGHECTVVVVYDTHNREWSTLPKHHDQVTAFGMAVVKKPGHTGGWFGSLYSQGD